MISCAIADRFGLALKDDSTLRGVASLAAKNRDPNTVKRFVIDQIRPGCGVPLAAHRALARIAPDTVMTTNYDDLYESALREEEMQFEKVVRSEQLVALPSNRPLVFKLHGDLDRPNEIVLTARDYREWHNGAGGLRTEVEAPFKRKYACSSATVCATRICWTYLQLLKGTTAAMPASTSQLFMR